MVNHRYKQKKKIIFVKGKSTCLSANDTYSLQFKIVSDFRIANNTVPKGTLIGLKE